MEAASPRSKARAPLRLIEAVARQQLEKLQSVVPPLAGKYQVRSNRLAFAHTPEFPRGYHPQHELSNQDTATADATVETFFYANITGDFDLLRSSLDARANDPELDDETKRRTGEHVKKMFARFPGYQIVSRVQTAPDKVKPGIKTSPDAKQITLTLAFRDRNWIILSKESDTFK